MFSAILKFVYLIYGLIDATSDVINYLLRKYNLIASYLIDKRQILWDLNSVRKLEKIPEHLTVLLGKEEPSLKDLTNVVLWSMFAGISFVSFYDSKGVLAKQEDKFEKEVLKHKPNGHVIWHSNHNTKHKNGHTGNVIHVKVYTEKDGREAVAQEAKNLIHHDLNIETVNNVLRNTYEFPDPDMAIYCGKSFFLYGYPPWQIRITEFFNVKTHHDLHYQTFINLMHKYSRCERRLGK